MRFFLLFINMQLSINLWGFGLVCTTSYGSATIITDNKILAFKVDWIKVIVVIDIILLFLILLLRLNRKANDGSYLSRI